MGMQLASAALARGHRVTVVSGPVAEAMPKGARVIPVERAAEMACALHREARGADAIIMAAAVSDFRPVRVVSSKVRRRARLRLAFEATPDIIGRLPRRPHQVVVGFALETDRVVARAKRKLREKQLDLLLAQQASRTGSPFGRRSVRAWLLSRDGAVKDLGTTSKSAGARQLFDAIEAMAT